MIRSFILLLVSIVLFSCYKENQPKPYGNLRLDFASPKYHIFSNNCPFNFEISHLAKLYPAKQDCWYNISYPSMKANIYFTYHPIQNNINIHTKEVEKMVYEHTIRANAIDTKSFSFKDKKIYGNVYVLTGQTASNIQFYATDSSKHFITGSLYFKTRPKPDSLAPAVDYVKKDIIHLVETLQWK